MGIPNLPLELISELLIQLPIKSLSRFRCVSKSWRSLISDPQFVKSHLNRSIALKQERVFSSAVSLQSIDCNLLFIDHDDVNAAVELDFPWRTQYTTVQILGSCNGLICLLIDAVRIIVCNPTTRYFKEIPPCPEIEGSNNVFFYGFGCDSSIHNYKVVKASFPSSSYAYIEFIVFSLNENSWRNQQLGHFSIVIEDVGTFLNGVVHWLGIRGTGPDQVNVIVYFDLSDEVLMEMPQPSHDDKTVGFHDLGVLQGCLCVLHHNGISKDVWMMRDYGVRESWTKFVVVPCDMGIRYIGYLAPLCVSKNGEVLLNINRRDIVIYNSKENTFTNLVIHIDHYWLETALYVESLLSPICIAWNDEH